MRLAAVIADGEWAAQGTWLAEDDGLSQSAAERWVPGDRRKHPVIVHRCRDPEPQLSNVVESFGEIRDGFELDQFSLDRIGASLDSQRLLGPSCNASRSDVLLVGVQGVRSA